MNSTGGYRILNMSTIAIDVEAGKTATVDVPVEMSDAIYGHKALLIQHLDIHSSNGDHVYNGFATKYYNGGVVHQLLDGIDIWSPGEGQLTITIP